MLFLVKRILKSNSPIYSRLISYSKQVRPSPVRGECAHKLPQGISSEHSIYMINVAFEKLQRDLLNDTSTSPSSS